MSESQVDRLLDMIGTAAVAYGIYVVVVIVLVVAVFVTVLRRVWRDFR